MSIPVEIVSEGIDWPAWVQAVGSVLAIFVAIGVIILQKALADKDRLRERAEFARLALELAYQAAHFVDDVERSLDLKKLSIDPSNAEDITAGLDRLPLERMPSAEFALAFVNVRRTVIFYGKQYAELLKLKDVPNSEESASEIRDVLKGFAEAVRLQFERLTHEAGNYCGPEVQTDPNGIHQRIRDFKRQQFGF